jgi:hypothetical protein
MIKKNRVIQQGIRSLFQTGNAFSAEEVKPRVPFGDANLFGKQPSIPFGMRAPRNFRRVC